MLKKYKPIVYLIWTSSLNLAINLWQVKVWFQNRRTKFKRQYNEEKPHQQGDSHDRIDDHSEEEEDVFCHPLNLRGGEEKSHEEDIVVVDGYQAVTKPH